MIKIVFFILILLVSVDAHMLTRTKVLMGTFVSISLDEKDKEHFKPAFSLLKTIENSISSFKKNSPIYKLNSIKTATLDTYAFEALFLSKQFYTQTDAYFNIAVGSITKDLYRFGLQERVPKKEQLQKSNTDLEGLKFNHKKASILNNMKIDLGGMGKGFGLDKVVAYLSKHNITKAIVAVSGDIRCLAECKIAINNPFSKEPLASFQTKGVSIGISTSGNYEHFVKSVTNNHLINPKTKSSQKNFVSITLISATLSSATLDAYATAVSVMPKKQAFIFLQKHSLAFIVLDSKKKLVVSHNIQHLVKDLLVNNSYKE